MKKDQLFNLAALVLFLIAAVMLYLGIANRILPPALTGVGFIVIAIVFLGSKSS